MKKVNIDENELLNLYHKGLSNSKIAGTLGVSQPTIGLRLRALGLQSNCRRYYNGKDGVFYCIQCHKKLSPNDFELNASGRTYRSKCKHCHRSQSIQRMYATEERQIRRKVGRLALESRQQGLAFNLDVPYLTNLLERQERRCFYTDTPIVFYKYREIPKQTLAPSIDKIVPELGYVRGNVVWTIKRLNTIKNNQTLEEMSKWMPGWYARIKNKVAKDPDAVILKKYLPA